MMCPGMMSEKICFPVQSGRGLRMAGCGTLPSHVDRNISRFITSPCREIGEGGFSTPKIRGGRLEVGLQGAERAEKWSKVGDVGTQRCS